jgi:hypothetical protein
VFELFPPKFLVVKVDCIFKGNDATALARSGSEQPSFKMKAVLLTSGAGILFSVPDIDLRCVAGTIVNGKAAVFIIDHNPDALACAMMLTYPAFVQDLECFVTVAPVPAVTAEAVLVGKLRTLTMVGSPSLMWDSSSNVSSFACLICNRCRNIGRNIIGLLCTCMPPRLGSGERLTWQRC